MFAAEQMHYVFLSLPCKQVRITAAQEIVEIALFHILVKHRICCFRRNIFYKRVNYASCLRFLLFGVIFCQKALCVFIELLHRSRIADIGSKGERLLIPQFLFKRRKTARHLICKALLSLSHTAKPLLHKYDRSGERTLIIKNHFGIVEHRKKFPVCRRTIKITSADFRYFRGIVARSAHCVIWRAVFYVFDIRPAFKKIRHFFKLPVLYSVRDDFRQTVNAFELAGFPGDIFNLYAPYQSPDFLGREHKVGNGDPQPPLLLGDRKTILLHAHCAFCRFGIPAEGFKIFPVLLQKGAEALGRRIFIGGVCGVKLHNGISLMMDAEAVDPLSAVCIKYPQRNPAYPSYPRQEA